MSRGRTVKPEFWTSEQPCSCSRDARLLFIGMWNFSDDNGVHPKSFFKLKQQIFSTDACSLEDIKKWVQELIDIGLIYEYSIRNESFWIITGFSKHQKVKYPAYKYPSPDGVIGEYKIICSDQKNYPRTPGGLGEDSRRTGGGLPEDWGSLPAEEKRSEVKRSEGNKDKNILIKSKTGFDRFWDRYPRKVGKGKARTAWNVKKLNNHFLKIMEDLDARETHCKGWHKENPFVPHPSTYLNQKRWEDEDKVMLQAPERQRAETYEEKKKRAIAEMQEKIDRGEY